MNKKKIAVIGAGISGLTCAYLLSRNADVHVFEANDYIGGHTATKKINVNNTEYSIDTGFIVFNDWTYPNFIKLLSQLKVEKQETEMSFSVHNESTNMEYNGNTINSLFAQRRNVISPTFLRLVKDIVRFNKVCKAALLNDNYDHQQTLGQFIRQHKFSKVFLDNYILPMCAAIWSASLEQSANFPIKFFLQFFNNHGLLNITNRPQWYTIVGGSNAYVPPLIENFKHNIRLNSPIDCLEYSEDGISLYGKVKYAGFDDVIFACHSDQALKILSKSMFADNYKTNVKAVLGNIPYELNDVVMHTDTSVLPDRKLAWASWNYRLTGVENEGKALAKVSYNMNILQKIDAPQTFVVSLNDSDNIDVNKVLGRYKYAHPQFSADMVEAQTRRSEICGVNGIHFCGAYWYNGFHEDGVRSALDVCQRFGESL
ncbi:NAD(P)/FAD-dependent oxidoreductase [Agaribacter marinus]|uniref:Amine oxidase n=1 Tax=Agaribacter marinus TaxID=1431249 RepID=A0AA37T7S2_9ALTE|nr:FAD-dependent oxidoreductase [Agaribacter marinus]GLR73075.1 amine oxidase [Agaribacter marinus]